MSSLALKAYRTTQTDIRCLDSDKRELVVMMYDGAIEAIRLARTYSERGENKAVGVAISRAVSILGGLRDTLDMEKGASVASHLNEFYRFLMRRLMRARGPEAVSELTDCEDLLSQVREAWIAISPRSMGEVNRRMFALQS